LEQREDVPEKRIFEVTQVFFESDSARCDCVMFEILFREIQNILRVATRGELRVDFFSTALNRVVVVADQVDVVGGAYFGNAKRLVNYQINQQI